VLVVFVSLAAPALAAGAGSSSQSCVTPFLHADKHGKKLFSFKPRVHAYGPMPSEVEDTPPAKLVCSPGGRIIDAGEIEDDDAHGASAITIMDGRLSEFVFNDLAMGFNLSRDRRFIVFRPWGGPEGKSSVLGAQTFYLIDVDQSLKPNSKAILSAVNVYPTDTDAFRSPADSKNTDSFDTWYDWFETLPHADEDITWTGPRQFTFAITADDSESDVHTSWSGKTFQVTANIVLAESAAPRVVLSIPKSQSCPRGVAAIHAIVDAVKACLK